jgi:transcription initiation factor TFIIE subunit alpha
MYRLRDEDMVYIMGMQSKELHKLCGKLREDRFLAV